MLWRVCEKHYCRIGLITTDAVEIFGTEDVSSGEQIQLICYFTEEISSLGWYKNQRRVLSSVDVTSSVTYEERWIRADLTIGGVTLADAGEYSCKAYTSGGSTETGRIKVHVSGRFIMGPWTVRSKLNKSECVQEAGLCTEGGWGEKVRGSTQLR